MKFSERLKTYGFYRPNQNCVVVPTCKNTSCNTEAKKTIQMFEVRLGPSPELPWSAQPFTTALGNIVCQYCGNTTSNCASRMGSSVDSGEYIRSLFRPMKLTVSDIVAKSIKSPTGKITRKRANIIGCLVNSQCQHLISD